MNDPHDYQHYGQLLRTVEPTKRSVLVHRLLAAVVAVGLAAGAAWLYVEDPRGWFGGETSTEGTAAGSPDPLPAATISSASTSTPAEDQSSEEEGSEVDATLTIEAADEPTAPAGATTARYVDLPTRRIVDTRADDADPQGPLAAGTEFAVELTDLVPDTAVAVVLSVNVAEAQGPGPITVDAGGEPVTAINVVGAGQMTTNLVVAGFGAVPASGPLQVTTVGGGHVVVDVVGYFEPVASSAAGRFVAVDTQRLAQLVTEVDGREAVIRPLDSPALPASGVSSVLVRISADVGGEGGMVRLGDELDELTNTMMWAGTSGEDRTRQGVAMVPLSELDELAFTYNGGSVLDLDVLGYFTDDTAAESSEGLFVPVAAVDRVEVSLPAGVPVAVDVAGLLGVAPDAIGSVIVNVSGSADQAADVFISDGTDPAPASPTVAFGQAGRRFGVAATTVDADGQIILTSTGDTAVEVVLPGYFTAG